MQTWYLRLVEKLEKYILMMKSLFIVRSLFYSIGILNVIEILQTIPFFPTYEANPFFREYPHILFTYKVVMFVIIVPFIFPKLLEK